MIDAVIFDIGNVLLKFDYLVAARRLMAHNGLGEPPERPRVVAAKEALEGGRIDRAEFLRLVRPEFSHTGTDAEFVAMWEDIFEVNEPMVRFAASLAARGMPTYLLSNISCIHHEFIFRRYPVFATFRDGVFSYRAGMLKPEPGIYEIAIAQFGVEPGRALFIDDLAVNVAAAERAGLRGLVYDRADHAAAERILRALGLESPPRVARQDETC
ncbi:MAG: HAD family phosphatase [Terrimicrobiaceae bacterium]|nr:HAD family phosphatase [Terrimicrobiaceae bacterium]